MLLARVSLLEAALLAVILVLVVLGGLVTLRGRTSGPR
ncbi:hypothetical protein BH24ACT4_BH24ACT4_23110 [soil metagenome]